MANEFNERNAQANFYFSTGQHVESIQNLRSNHKMPIGADNSRSDLNGSTLLQQQDSCLLPKKKTKEASTLNFERNSDRYKKVYGK